MVCKGRQRPGNRGTERIPMLSIPENPLVRYLHVLRLDFNADKVASHAPSNVAGSSASEKRIQYRVPLRREQIDEKLWNPFREHRTMFLRNWLGGQFQYIVRQDPLKRLIRIIPRKTGPSR